MKLLKLKKELEKYPDNIEVVFADFIKVASIVKTEVNKIPYLVITDSKIRKK